MHVPKTHFCWPFSCDWPEKQLFSCFITTVLAANLSLRSDERTENVTWKPYRKERRLKMLYMFRRPNDSFVVILLHLLQRNQKMFQLIYIKNKKSRKNQKAKHRKFLAFGVTQQHLHCGDQITSVLTQKPPADSAWAPPSCNHQGPWNPKKFFNQSSKAVYCTEYFRGSASKEPIPL